MKRDEREQQLRVTQGEPGTSRARTVLSTSLGVALVANMAMVPAAHGSTAVNVGGEAKLVEWSSDAVKAYFDPQVDWNIALPNENGAAGSTKPTETPEPDGSSAGSSGGNTYISHGGGFGWDDLLLYHLIFNRGGVYSSNQYYTGRNATYAGTTTPYVSKKYDSTSFQNKSVPNSNVTPKTSNSTGSIVRRSATSTNKSTSSSTGSIGGKSSGFGSGSSSSSSSSSKSSSSSSGSFGG